jgi:hypothetical protein
MNSKKIVKKKFSSNKIKYKKSTPDNPSSGGRATPAAPAPSPQQPKHVQIMPLVEEVPGV